VLSLQVHIQPHMVHLTAPAALAVAACTQGGRLYSLWQRHAACKPPPLLQPASSHSVASRRDGWVLWHHLTAGSSISHTLPGSACRRLAQPLSPSCPRQQGG
jgi:hypothetical protein